jgi:RNA recognition motif-containing protein
VAANSPGRGWKREVTRNATLYLDNLSLSTTEDELVALFGQVGEVTSIEIYRDRQSGASKGYGSLSMSALSEADRAISRFHDHSVNGHNIHVRLSKPRAVRGDRSGR